MNEYTGINFNDLADLDCITFAKLRLDAFVYKMKQSKEGREYLEQAWTLEQTTPDLKALRRKFR